MRILQIASFYAPTLGGMETVLQDLAEGLVAAGDQVTVVCASEGPRGARETRGGVEVVRSPSLGKALSQPMTPFLPATLLAIHRSFDVLHLHMPNPLSELATVALPSRVPIVVTYHADIIRQRLMWPVFAPVRRAILARCRRVVVPTENHVRYSEVLEPIRGKVTVVPFGLSPARYELAEAGRARARAIGAQHGTFALFVGRLVHYKGLAVLMESMRDVGARLVVVGDGPLRGEAVARAAALGVGERVTFVGRVPQDELNAYFEACALLVLPSTSRAENFGMVLLEAMQFGKPLVTTRVRSGMDLVNEDGVTGLKVEPNEPRALAVALNRLLGDDELRERLGTAARARVGQHFSLERMVAGYRAVYAQVAA